MKDNYQILIEKLDAFIRKYYKNQLIRGAIYSFGLCLAFYLVVTLLESIGRFNTGLRTFLFYSLLAGNIFILIRFILVPLSKLYRIGSVISHEEAAQIIGSHFSEVKDKLLNTLQLREQYGAAGESQSSDLVMASVNQKIDDLKPVPFVSAVNLGENRKYLRYALIPLVALGVVFFSSPSLIKDSTQRLLNHNTYFEKPAPFVFEVVNKNLRAVQQSDFTLDVMVKGEEIPAVAYIEIDGNQFKMEKENNTIFHYTFRNIQKSTEFRLTADGFFSRKYLLEALPNPLLMNFEISLDYPAYLHKTSETVRNTGDLVIPAGTRAAWKFNTRNTESLVLAFADTNITAGRKGGEEFAYSRRFLKSNTYAISTSNQYFRSGDSLHFSVSVIPDGYPTITVEQQKDSNSTKRLFFKGIIKDDYGFSRLTFNYRYLKSADSSATNKQGKEFTENIPVGRDQTSSQFFHFWDAGTLDIAAGDEVEYYFEVSDNDGVTGPKSTRSQTQVFKAPTLKEVEENTAKTSESIKQDLVESIEQAKQLQKETSDLNKKLLDKKEAGWEDKKKAQEILKKQDELAKKLEDIKKQNQQKNNLQSEYKKPDSDLMEKQKQLQDLIDKLMNPELRKVFEEMQKMLDQADKQKLQQQMENMKLDNKDLQKELDRALELFKQLEFQQKLQDNIDKLNDLAKKQDDLSKQAEDKNADSKDLQKKQEELTKEFEDFQKQMEDMEKKNAALEEPNKMENTEPQQKDIQQDQKNSEEQLSKDQKGKAGKSQKSASQKMKQLADKMSKMQEDMQAEQQEEDMAALRALLENLLRLSFDQEKLMQDLKSMDVNNPKYLKAMQDQRKLKDDALMIEDSLTALSKRVIQIQKDVSREINAINLNTDAALENLEDRYVPQARSRQQYVMTAVNNLALMLSESLNQMQKEANSKQSKSGKSSSTCKKPGGGMPKSIGDLKKMQESLNKNMQKLKDQMKQQSGMPKPGKTGKQGEGGMSEQLAKMAAEQEYIRNELSKLNMQDNKDGKKSLGNLEDITKKMEESENDIVNKMISDQTIQRQQEILTRLLESERAEREREQDEQRKSTEAKNNFNRNPDAFEEYKRIKQKETELLRTVPPSLNSYYRKKVNDYFQSIEK